MLVAAAYTATLKDLHHSTHFVCSMFILYAQYAYYIQMVYYYIQKVMIDADLIYIYE